MDFKSLSKKYESIAMDSLVKLVAIDSVYDESTVSEAMPYGKGVNNALNFLMEFGKQYGFECKNIDNRCVEMTIGCGERLIGVFAHTDVVPVTGKWDNDPFTATFKDGKVYGRGTSDDKGPLMAAFFASLLLYDNNLLNGYRIRIVVGGDEERGSSCLEHYFSKDVEIPTYGITPDADFPVVYGEKGIGNFTSKFEVNIPNVIKIDAGVVPNAVIDRAVVTLAELDNEFISYLKERNIEIEIEGNDVIFIGKSAHGSTPEYGVNSGIIALKSLADFYKVERLATLVSLISDYTGKAFDCYSYTDNLGATTFNIGILSYENNELTYVTNFRFPETVNAMEVVKKYDEVNKTTSVCPGASNYLLFDRESFLIQTLMKAYQEETGDYESKPIALGGGTYAKEAKNTVAFGATFPGENTHMHEPNEFMNVENFNKCIAIYAHALYLLGSK